MKTFKTLRTPAANFKRLVIVWLCVVSVSVAPVNSAEVKLDNNPRLAFTYRNKEFTYLKLTGIPNDRTKRIAKEAMKLNHSGKLHVLSYIGGIDGSRFPQKPEDALNEFCVRQINSIIRVYIKSFIYDNIRAKYSRINNRFFRESEIKSYCIKYSELRHKWNAFYQKSLIEDWSPERYAKGRGIECTAFTRSSFEKMKRNLPIYYLLYNGFTPVVNGHPAPWVNPRTKAHLIFYQIAAILQKDRAHWYPLWKEYEMEKEYRDDHVWDIVVLLNVIPRKDELSSIDKGLRDIVDNKGRIAIRGKDKLNRLMHSMGSSISVSYFSGVPFFACENEYGLDVTSIPVRRLVPVPIYKLRNGRLNFRGLKFGYGAYIYVLNCRKRKLRSTVVNRDKLKWFGLPLGLYYYARPKIVRPFVMEVLGDIKCCPPYTKPSLEVLVKEVGCDMLQRGVCGDAIFPSVVENPVKWVEKE